MNDIYEMEMIMEDKQRIEIEKMMYIHGLLSDLSKQGYTMKDFDFKTVVLVVDTMFNNVDEKTVELIDDICANIL